MGYDNEGLWYNKMFTKQQWLSDWQFLTNRYKNKPWVVGMDLRNEIRVASIGGLPAIPNWGQEPNDWRKVAEEAAELIHEINPNVLIVVEGINFPRRHLQPVADKPIRLKVPNKLVYGAHNYAYIGPGWDLGTLLGAIGLGDLFSFTKYQDFDYPEYREIMEKEIGYVLEGVQHYTAPVWLSEFGTDKVNPWFQNIVRYMNEKDMDFAYWPVTGGIRPNGYFERYGLLKEDFVTPIQDDRLALLQSIMMPTQGPGISSGDSEEMDSVVYRALSFYNKDQNESGDPDWFANRYKGSCPLSMRMVGISLSFNAVDSITSSAIRARHALCSEVENPMIPVGNTVINKNNEDSEAYIERVHTNFDWRSGASKLECGENQYIAGIAVSGSPSHDVAGVLCKTNSFDLSNQCVSRAFVNGDNRGSPLPGDWSPGYRKSQCGEDEYIAGVALKNRALDALLCCKL